MNNYNNEKKHEEKANSTSFTLITVIIQCWKNNQKEIIILKVFEMDDS